MQAGRRERRWGYRGRTKRRSHVLVGLIVQQIADIENHGLVAEVLPPMRRAARLGPDVAGLVHDRRRAIAGVFDDLTFGNEDEGWPIGMAVPRHYAIGVDGELAEPQLAVLDLCRFLVEVDGAERGIGDANSGELDRLAGIGLHLVERTAARKG